MYASTPFRADRRASKLRVIGFKHSDDLVIALVELLPGNVLEIICSDHLGIGDTIRSFIEYYQRTLF
jgi:hypothetical protein